MKYLYPKKELLVIVFVTAATTGYSQQYFFTDVAESAFKNTAQKRVIIPSRFRTLLLNKTAMLQFLLAVPAGGNSNRKQDKFIIGIPMPKGDTARFFIWESSAMSPELASKFPDIKSYSGQGITDETATIKIDWTEFGFHAMVLSPVTGSVFIDPYSLGTVTNYISYFKEDLKKNDLYIELAPKNVRAGANKPLTTNNVLAGACRGTQLYKYRLAVACTHQYAIAATGVSNPTIAQALAKIVTTVNRVNGVYEKEVAVTMVLVGTENNVIFTNVPTDPFKGNDDGTILIDESQHVIDSAIGNNNYDIGHTFSTGGGGLADVGVVCRSGLKASGITGSPSPTGDGYDIDYVAHEIGHEFGANHPFNSISANCGSNNINYPTAYEPGSGTTIMGYAGICGTDNIQAHSDPYFHTISFDEISNYLQSGATCQVVVSTGNTPPQITAMNNNGLNIPLSTPFTLTASATDANGDAITYDWEEWDAGHGGPWNGGGTTTTEPLFKSRIPKTTGSRTFPDIAVILAGYPSSPPATMGGLKGETLPSLGRPVKFRLTVRDNRAGGGGVVTGGDGCQTGFTNIFQVNTITGTGPFIVTAPDGGEIWAANSTQTITWNPAGTAAAPINCTNVTIQLSTDGGNTYPVTLLPNTPNDGTEQVTLPASATATAVIRVTGDNNIFFDISNGNFKIVGPYISKANGNWNNPATWLGGVVPSAGVDVIVQHTVTVTAIASCYSLTVQPTTGNLIINNGIQLNITH
ncbi:MAG: reprolysin-like metallopeptidase [Ginsengibacter sp.]